jgi:DNA polymerase III alpha subunit
MTISAKVHATDALVDFRAALLEFQSAARQALDMLEVEARQGVEWITVDRVRYWKRENRLAWDALSQAKDNYRQARIQRQVAEHTPECIEEKKAIARAETRLKTSERKIAATQHWAREAHHTWNEFQVRFAQTLSVLEGDLPRGVAVLEKLLRQLEEYLQATAPSLDRAAASADAAAGSSGELPGPATAAQSSEHAPPREHLPPGEAQTPMHAHSAAPAEQSQATEHEPRQNEQEV